jgi:transglutaminase-like putative cysteine protease
MRRLSIDHLTEYRFAAPARLLPHRMLLRPRENYGLRIVSSRIEIEPSAHVRWHRDTLDNSVAIVSFAGAQSDRLRVESSLVVEHFDESPLDFVVEDHAVNYPFGYLSAEAAMLAPFREATWPEDHAALATWLATLGPKVASIETFVLLDGMNRAINERFRYEVREDFGVQSPARTIERGAGSCRDFATLFMEACRQLGLASRFVSGYLHAPLNPAFSGSSHAWAEVYLPGAGWRGFDPITGRLVGRDHIAVAVAHHPEHVAPISGSFIGSAGALPTLHVAVDVRAL